MRGIYAGLFGQDADELQGIGIGLVGSTLRHGCGIFVGGLGLFFGADDEHLSRGADSASGILIGGLGIVGESLQGIAVAGLGMRVDRMNGIAIGGFLMGGNSY